MLHGCSLPLAKPVVPTSNMSNKVSQSIRAPLLLWMKTAMLYGLKTGEQEVTYLLKLHKKGVSCTLSILSQHVQFHFGFAFGEGPKVSFIGLPKHS